MGEIIVPRLAFDAAVRHARCNTGYEVGGAFVTGAVGVGAGAIVRYVPGVNVAEDPARNIQLDAEWISDLIVSGTQELVSFFHSHPGGRAEPSEDDIAGFPWYYVSKCFIYFGDPEVLVAYDRGGWEHISLAHAQLAHGGVPVKLEV